MPAGAISGRTYALADLFDQTVASIIGRRDRDLFPEPIYLQIEDTETGFATAQQSSIFLLFNQSLSDNVKSEGLGLAISQDIVKEMGRAIKVESMPKKGSIFWFDLTLPVVEKQSLEAAAIPLNTKLPNSLSRSRAVDSTSR
ncbi:MAG: ATP-binding protein [Cyanobacteria bacterium J06623_7]